MPWLSDDLVDLDLKLFFKCLVTYISPAQCGNRDATMTEESLEHGASSSEMSNRPGDQQVCSNKRTPNLICGSLNIQLTSLQDTKLWFRSQGLTLT